MCLESPCVDRPMIVPVILSQSSDKSVIPIIRLWIISASL